MSRSEVDTSRPFQSVKEAVAVFGDRILFNNSSSFKTTNPNSSPIGPKTNPNLDASPKPEPLPSLQSLDSSSIETNTNPNLASYTKTISPPPLESLSSPSFDTNVNHNLDASPKSLNTSPIHISVPTPAQSYFSSPINRPMYSAQSSPRSFSSSISNSIEQKETETENLVFNYLNKLEQEVAETKKEVITLKKRETEMEIALATLNAQLNRNLSKLAEIEAMRQEENSEIMEEKIPIKVRSNRWEEESANSVIRDDYLPSFREALSLGDLRDDNCFEMKRKMRKMKPIVPLVGDIFKKKKSLKYTDHSFYSPSIYTMLS